jgi:hypothetical protein
MAKTRIQATAALPGTWFLNAGDVKHLPGRPKIDRLNAVWLRKVAERQMLRPSFVPPPVISGLLGPLRAGGQRIRRSPEGQGRHREREPLPGPDPREGRGQRRPHRYLPRRALSTDRPSPRQEASDRADRPLDPGHRLDAALRRAGPVRRPRSGLLRLPHQHRAQGPPPRPRAAGPRLLGHLNPAE